MTIRSGFQTFDFQQAFELPKPLTFATDAEALGWLKTLWSQHPEVISRFREYLARYSWQEENARLTDHQTMERLAVLLHSRRVVVVVRESRTGGAPAPRDLTLAPPFPLSERRRRVEKARVKTWIAIELKDSDGNRMAGEKYKLTLPDGRIQEGHLDGMGMARVSEIDPGECDVSFPRLAGSTWSLAGSRL